MTKITLALWGTIFLLAVVVPLFAQAAIAPYWGPVVSCSGSSCTTCDLFETAQNFIKVMLSLLVVVIVPVMIAVGGIMIIISGPNENWLKTGKSMVTGAVVGLLIGAGAFIIINTLLFILGTQKLPTGAGGAKQDWWNINCSSPAIQQF